MFLRCPSREHPPEKLCSRIKFIYFFLWIFITSYLWDLVWLMLRLQMDFKRVLIACNVITKLTTLFGRDTTFILQVSEKISAVVVGLEASRTLVCILFNTPKLSILRICKRKRLRLVWKVKVFHYSFHKKRSWERKEKNIKVNFTKVYSNWFY